MEEEDADFVWEQEFMKVIKGSKETETANKIFTFLTGQENEKDNNNFNNFQYFISCLM